MRMPTNQAAFYFPLDNGRYEVKPGLSPLNTDFGNGQQDARLVQIDNHYTHYRNNKLTARDESLGKYVCQLNAEPALPTINQFIIKTLCTEYPDYFLFNPQQNVLDSMLTDERLVFDSQFQLDSEASRYQLATPYINGWDALAMQLQEDLAIMRVEPDGKGNLVALHLCAPNHWAAQNKIGKDFLSIHQPVPGMERINQRAREINRASLNKGPFVRFAWGLATDKRLNHHPLPAPDTQPEQWHGRIFNPANPQLYLRIERQTLSGFKEQGYVLFTIRSYFHDVQTLNPIQKQQLLAAIQSMSDETLRYKGLLKSKQNIEYWLTKHLSL